jgi:hypothetical protein
MRLAAVVVVLVAGIALAGAPSTAKKKAKAPAKKPDAGATAPSRPGALEFGTLEFEIKGDFVVSLDGKDLGKTPLKPVKVLAGKHQLRLVNVEARIDHVEEVEVKPRQVSTFQISLAPEE